MLNYPIHHVLVRHEQGGAPHGGCGYACASGKVVPRGEDGEPGQRTW